jgi:hypothetical protein
VRLAKRPRRASTSASQRRTVKAVAAKRLTQQRADELLERLTEAVERLVDRHLAGQAAFQQKSMTYAPQPGPYSSTAEAQLHETEKTMHAALVNLTIDPDQAPAAANALVADILPAIRSAPGFVAGYWLEPVDGHGFSFVVFETEEQARRSALPASGWAAPGVSIDNVDFRRVAVNA